MTISSPPSSCLSSWTDIQECGLQYTHSLINYINKLEKSPQGNSNIWEKYSTSIANSWATVQQNPTPHTILDFLSTVTYLKETSKDLGLASLTLISTIAKNSLKEVANHFFKLCPPLLPIDTSNPVALNFRALITIAGLVTIEAFAGSYVQSKHLEEKIDFTTMGTVVGTTISWVFDQNLYFGAFAGTTMGMATGFIAPLLNPILTPAQNFLSDVCIKTEIKKLLIAFPPAVFLASSAYIANQSPETQWPSVFCISLIPTLATSYTLFYNSKASSKVAHKAYQHLIPTAWLAYSSMVLSLALQQAMTILEAKLEN